MSKQYVKPSSYDLTFTGKKFNIPKVGQVTLYPISRLSAALTDAGYPRDSYTIRESWIRKKKLLPPPLFVFKRYRYWSIEQINLIVETVTEFNLKQGDKETDKWKQFRKVMWERWGKLNKELYFGKSK